MKFKSVFILFLFAGLFLASCQKQQIAPNSERTLLVPTWTDSSSNARTADGDGEVDPPNPGDTPTDGITDPNSDPDGDKPSKSKKN